jgi:serine/threonine protein kinase
MLAHANFYCGHTQKISREIDILKILRHNNIVPLWGIATGFGWMSELHCLVSPWMPNGTLNAYLSDHNDLTVLDRSHMVSNSHHIFSLFKTQSKFKAGGCQRWTSLPWVSIYLPQCSNCSLPLM